MTLLAGRAPVTELGDYAQEVAAYTRRPGPAVPAARRGTRPCHNPDAVIAAADYDPEADLENTPDSVFCAHGGGLPREVEQGGGIHAPARLSGKAPG